MRTFSTMFTQTNSRQEEANVSTMTSCAYMVDNDLKRFEFFFN